MAASIHKGQVPDRWPYLLGKLDLEDEAWGTVSIGALVRISQATSRRAVDYALTIASLSPPKIETTAYGWLLRTAQSFAKIGV